MWIGFLMTGGHPTLVGVVLGLMSPVRSIPLRGHPFEVVSRVLSELRSSNAVATKDTHRLDIPLRKLRVAQREILPPVVRVQAFTDERLPNAAKLSVLPGSLVAAMLGLGWGTAFVRRLGGQRDQH